MSIDFQNLLKTLKDGVISIAKKNLKNYLDAATEDGKNIISLLCDDLHLWTQQMESGILSKDDFEDLLEGQKDELKMTALKEAGLAEIQVDQFKNDIFNLIKTTLLALIP